MKRRWNYISRAVVAATTTGLGLALGLAPVEAHAPGDPGGGQELSRMLVAVESVIYGTVTKVEYRMSTKKSAADEILPYTFVTYEIREKIRGRTDKDTVTLRFIGGPAGQGRFLTVTGVPLFNVGNEDVLFIQGNGKADCPLVNCEFGRFRVFQGRVYNSAGIPVTGVRKGRVIAEGPPELALRKASFPAPAFDDLIKRKDVQEKLKTLAPQGNVQELARRFEKEAPKEIEYRMEVEKPRARQDRAERSATQAVKPGEQLAAQTRERESPAVPSAQGPPIQLGAFLKALKDELRQMPKVAEPAIVSVNPDQPFTVGRPPVAAPKPSPAPAPQPAESPKEREERELLEKQDFNPVLKRPSR